LHRRQTGNASNTLRARPAARARGAEGVGTEERRVRGGRNAGGLPEIDDRGRVNRAPPLAVRAEAVVAAARPAAQLGGQVWWGREVVEVEVVDGDCSSF